MLAGAESEVAEANQRTAMPGNATMYTTAKDMFKRSEALRLCKIPPPRLNHAHERGARPQLRSGS